MVTTEETRDKIHGEIPISVVIPTYNRPSEIEGCLESLASQEYPKHDFEVIVIDDGGVHPLDPVIRLFQRRIQLSLIRRENGGPAAARNSGIYAARGKYIAMTDDDCRPHPDWLTTVMGALSKDSDAMVGGHTMNILENNPFADASQVLVNMIYRFYNRDPKHSRFFTSNNIIAKRQLILDIGSFRENFRLAEDREFCNRWLAAGLKMHYCPRIKMYHRHDLTWRTFWRQHFGYGKGGYQYQKLRRERRTGSLRQDANFHVQFYRWLPVLFDNASILTVCRRVVLILISQIANFSGFVAQHLSNGQGDSKSH